MGTMPPMVFGCTTCNGTSGFEKTKGFKPVRYHMWVRHLTEDRHQEKVKRFYPNINSLRSELPVDDNRYVIVGMPPHMGHHLLFRLAVWLAEFGVLTDLVYLKEKGLVTATIQAAGLGLGRRGKGVERAENIVNETEFKSDKYTIPIRVFRKDRMTNEDWLAIERGQVSRELKRMTKSPPDFVPFQARSQHSNIDNHTRNYYGTQRDKENVKAGPKKRRNKRRAGDDDRSSNRSPKVAVPQAALKEVTKEADNTVSPPARQQIMVGEEVGQVASVQPNNIGNGNRRETLVSCETSGNDSILNHGGSLSIHGADDQLGGRPRDDEFPMQEIKSTEAALVFRRNSSCSRHQKPKSRIVHDILEKLARDDHAQDEGNSTTCAGVEAPSKMEVVNMVPFDPSESTSVNIKTTIDKEGAAQPKLPPAEKTHVTENVGRAKAANEPEKPHVPITTENVVQVQAAKDIEPPKVFNDTAKMKDSTSDPEVRGKPDKVSTREPALSSKSSGEADVILSSSSSAEIKEASKAVGSASEAKRLNECQAAASAPPAKEDEDDSWKYSTFQYWSIR